MEVSLKLTSKGTVPVSRLAEKSGCGGADGVPEGVTTMTSVLAFGLGPPEFATVVFSYIAPTATGPAVAAMFPQCVQGVNVTHLHAGWSDFQAFPLTAMGPNRWEITFINVPVGSEQRIRISDPNTCALNATGASTEGVSANGTLLTRVVDTPGTGIEPGLAFEVAANGSVTP